MSYRDSSGRCYEGTSTLDLDAMRGSTYVAVKTFHDAVESLGAIEKTLGGASVLARNGTLKIDATVEPRGVAMKRDQAEAAERRRAHEAMRDQLLPKQVPLEPDAPDG